MDDRLTRQLHFCSALDQLKNVNRRNLVTGGARRESAAEHSWHLALMVVLLAEHADGELDLPRAVQMALVHDVVEVEAGDTYCYDTSLDPQAKAEREASAAASIFAQLPADQGQALLVLWQEFESAESAEAKLVRAIDRIQPVLLHLRTAGAAWREHGVTREQVQRRVAEIERNVPELWPAVQRLLDEATARGWLAER